MDVARKRYITSEISIDDKVASVAEVNPIAALMWPWFLKELDDWGRMKANPREIKLEVFPAFNFTPKELRDALECYHDHGLAWLYEADGKPYMQVNPDAWYRLQSYIQVLRRNRDDSPLPPPLDHPWGQWWKESRWYENDARQISANFADQCTLSANVADKQQKGTFSDPSPSPSPTEDIDMCVSGTSKRESYPPDFDEFWVEYPRKVNKKGAFAKWKVTLKSKDTPPTKQQLIDCAKRYAEQCKRKGTTADYIMHAATFLGPQERWRDYLEDTTESQSQTVEYLPYGSGADVLALIEERRKAGGAH